MITTTKQGTIMTDLFDALKVTETVEENKDTLGGMQLLDSGVYPVTIQAMFVGTSAGGAVSVTIHALTDKGESFRTTQYVTSSRAKGGKPYYTRNGKNYFLPGYNMINAVCALACDKSIAEMEREDKTIMLYDYDAGGEKPTVVSMLVEAIGKKVALGIQKQVVDKNKKNETTGVYEPTGETREVNELDAVFSFDTGLTHSETKDKQEEPVFLGKWKDKWAGKVNHKAKGLEGSTGSIAKAAAGATPKPTKSLFK